ncbi:MAG: U2 snRNP complex subunit msl1 [Peltula sp. TS41687]|nr:MAG: U2 snRNP complex subunit msl1 [Peltula sp. TS41687]
MATKSIPSRTAPSASNSTKPSLPPNQTLYVKNLPDKIQKTDLRTSLYILFSTYGPVLDVVALKTMKMRGQAHVVFRDVQASSQAMRTLQGFEFFGREMRISYAKTKSDTIAKLDGTYRMPAAAAGAVTSTELQQSIFGAPPSAVSAAVGTTASGANLKPPDNRATSKGEDDEAKSPQGMKRRREDESDEEDAPMDEDDDGDAPMEDSD